MVRSAITMLNNWQGTNVAIRIHKICHSLSCLPIQSARLSHNEIVEIESDDA